MKKTDIDSSKKSITIVELLCAIIIVSLFLLMGIRGLSVLREDSQVSLDITQDEKSISNSTANYLKDNPEKLPEIVGDTTRVSFQMLKSTGYFKKNILATYRKCIDNSYVNVYKLSKSEYTYSVDLECNHKEKDRKTIMPFANIYFVKFQKSDKIKDSTLYMEMSGGYSSFGNPIPVDGYSYSILVQKDKDDSYLEVYHSPYLKADRKDKLEESISLSKYVKEDVYNVKVKLQVRNIYGEYKEVEVYQKND